MMLKTLMRRWIVPALALVGLAAGSPTVSAHGEKALEPFIRTRTIQFYDVAWSKPEMQVNDEVAVTGRFHVADDWPVGVPKPEAAFLNMSSPGPVFIRTERTLNGQPWLNSVSLKPGGDYEFKVMLKARLPGRYHIHPFMNLRDAGPVQGPGQWIEVGGDAAAFDNRVTALNGATIDMESYGLANGVFWHALWIAAGLAWLLWWVRRPLFLPRHKMLLAGREEALITPLDKTLAKAILVAVPVVVLGANAMAQSRYPDTIPLQAALDRIDPLPPEVNNGDVRVRLERVEYRVSDRAMVLIARIDNHTGKPIRVGEFTTANLRFLDPLVAGPLPAGPDGLVASEGLRIDDPAPIAPGETRQVRITATDSGWETEKLDGLIRDADSRLGGLLFFFDADGRRSIASVSAAVIPSFN
ncbi:methane/ammonia monooxygenase subunit B [Methylomagnum ishizawai]|uniref:Methane/ammonia monooxygenase subunit B n=1 Tax=Methylomagnum ishizawai TaxID=1760988 RepID=A0A1Y6DAU7_9GAMM|nr:bacterial ammonia monooxygenase, subunit AmoB [Methylomagnum ishizawai]SMF97432.1 methane/ammonia monooxygenase subunit B [Methylomagnum ishizawai]